ncbi:MAG: LamG domain-containing protein [Candidatus Marsarchaeota archaeon]|nr:LamG domain-containing protein [Candidatus Marsarchaeota archaeon]
MAQSRAQSAMEYLMTYGWAILVIAVVLGALFQLGVFNAGTFAPRSPPGSCQVFRPNGPGSASLASLEGICNGQLPQYVLNINGNGGGVVVNNNPLIGFNNFTISAWLYESGSSVYSNCCGGAINLMSENDCGRVHIYREWAQGSTSVTVCASNATNTIWDYVNPSLPVQRWNFITATYNSVYLAMYYNGAPTNTAKLIGPLVPLGSLSLCLAGSANGCDGNEYLNGSMANIQIYNRSFSANEVQYMYAEGIGGAPIDPQHLVGWWPLNGNANDYSGNNNNGVPNGVTYTAQWASGYTVP